MSLPCALLPLVERRCKSPREAPPTGAGFGPFMPFAGLVIAAARFPRTLHSLQLQN